MIQDNWNFNGQKIPDDVLLSAMRRYPIVDAGHASCDLGKIDEVKQQIYIQGRCEERFANIEFGGWLAKNAAQTQPYIDQWRLKGVDDFFTAKELFDIWKTKK